MCPVVDDKDGLDSDTCKLVIRLLTRAGMIMEDASAVAVLAADERRPLTEIVDELDQAAGTVHSLIKAAKALLAVPSSGMANSPLK